MDEKECCKFAKVIVIEGFLVMNKIVPLADEVEINYCMFCGTKLSPPAEEQVPHIIDSGKEHEALLEIKAILNKLWLPMKED